MATFKPMQAHRFQSFPWGKQRVLPTYCTSYSTYINTTNNAPRRAPRCLTIGAS
ncbi:hypothetical protein BU14_0269s0029 [Porphyra umbilicalis]|uniref:Uncharacterized protein n=1 Tax=Porphyra umbilicalis TaxID=2786 RepID=A0A1X6P1J9_PORUM|nr:hypothetical protein BU14_0269s0029 [Porphyra umbilicalis]|eukprot:OSX74749.1 hypothetical protein BU14_0269s0029 [Porphyra umbilicalis]